MTPYRQESGEGAGGPGWALGAELDRRGLPCQGIPRTGHFEALLCSLCQRWDGFWGVTGAQSTPHQSSACTILDPDAANPVHL